MPFFSASPALMASTCRRCHPRSTGPKQAREGRRLSNHAFIHTEFIDQLAHRGGISTTCLLRGTWLPSLGLGKYEAIFRENDIDETVLPSLTHENLKELGVASFGHRVKLIQSRRRTCQGARAVPTSVARL